MYTQTGGPNMLEWFISQDGAMQVSGEGFPDKTSGSYLYPRWSHVHFAFFWLITWSSRVCKGYNELVFMGFIN